MIRRGWILGILIGLAPPTAAQRVTFTPLVGHYAPLRDQLFRVDVAPSSTGYAYDTTRIEVGTGLLLGGTVGVRVTSFLALEATVATATATRRTYNSPSLSCCPITPTPPQEGTGRFRLASLRAVVRRKLTSGLEAHVGAGPALVVLQGPGYGWARYDPLRDHSVIGLAVGAGLGLGLRTWVHLDLGVTDHAYGLDFGEAGLPPNELESKTQHDLVTSLGFRLALRQ